MLLAWLLATALTPQSLWAAWPAQRVLNEPAPCLRPAALADALRLLAERHPRATRLEQVGQSVEGRPIFLLSVGRGSRHVLLWSQMHGDEPSATPALLDLVAWLLASDAPAAQRVLDELTLLIVPMLNPDGAERYERRNSQGIDINRDALALATPEGRVLKALRERFEPLLGFNLHDQDRRTTVGTTDQRASIALLAVAGDPAGTLTPGRMRAKRACAALVSALGAFVPAAIARYDEDWSERAFGDNLTRWGTPVVLIESGAPPAGRFEDLTRLNFVGLATVLVQLAQDDLTAHDPALYDNLPRNSNGRWADVLVANGQILHAPTATAQRSDLAFQTPVPDRVDAGCAAPDDAPRAPIVEVGDARLLVAGRRLDARGALLVPPFLMGLRGWQAEALVDAPTLAAWGRLGVGRLRWLVAPGQVTRAQARARALAAPGRPHLEITQAAAQLPPVTLARRPSRPRSARLSDVLEALLGGTASARLGSSPALQALSTLAGGPLAPRAPSLGESAAFLLVRPRDDAKRLEAAALETFELEATWLHGHEQAGPR
jgi:hypothetical protein